ncbi:MAG TPA: TIM-barrel domain-containing protein [Vicinamibacterales bacterium]|nr:TIM-barrel domain-containing protein [Vicinamibacterales bacterium]
MSDTNPTGVTRRDAIKQLGAAGAAVALGGGVIRGQGADIVVGGSPVEIVVTSVSPVTVRILVLPIAAGAVAPLPVDGSLVQSEWGRALARARAAAPLKQVTAGNLRVRFTDAPPTLHVETLKGEAVQTLTLDATTPAMKFRLPKGPLLGLGEGGQQFDRKGTIDRGRSGQGGYQLRTHGGRVPIQWLIGTDGWGMFIHQPLGGFDLSAGLRADGASATQAGGDGVFTPMMTPPTPPGGNQVNAPQAVPATTMAPLDVFVTATSDPAVLMLEYSKITGRPEMPPLWTFGYQQSHRTLEGPDQILGIARTFREKKLPCDALIYLGTDFSPSGWNTHNGEFTWHPTNFADPKKMIDTLHAEHFKIVLHVAVEGRVFTGGVNDPCTAPPIPPGRLPNAQGQPGAWPPERQVSCYWPAHKPLFDIGVDGWWPDQGDAYDPTSRLNRIRMYWEGSQLYRPNERAYALHRNGYPGMSRYGAFLWSGDIYSTWDTLKAHVPVAVNTALSGIPFWGTDIGGFVPTPELTGELYVRWFQFGAFNPLFRSHGRSWQLRLPFGWNRGTVGISEWAGYGGGAGDPPPEALHDERVEPICRKYLELRYRLMPYLYSAVRECAETNLPIIRSMWLHYPDDPIAVARGDQYLWGRDILVAPVVERGATSRTLYLPRGAWYDYWTGQRTDGGREVERAVDLETMPLYVRAGAIVPTGPVKQYTDDAVDGPLTIVVYPGADRRFTLYEDDGKSFEYRNGDWMGIVMTWRDASRTLSLSLAPGSRMRAPMRRTILARVPGSLSIQSVTFEGKPVELRI